MGLKGRKSMTRASLTGAGVAAGIAGLGAASASAAQINTPPLGCNFSSAASMYDYTPSALNACGIKTAPRDATLALSGGGYEYDYHLDGELYRYFVPPPGFDPRTATAAQLQEYRVPPRPTDLAALSRWQTEMSNFHPVAPPAFLAENPNVHFDTVYTANWAGYAITSPGPFTSAQAYWYEPNIYGSACSTNAEVQWAGIGGYSGNYIGQDGTGQGNDLGAIGFGPHESWTETFPDGAVAQPNLYATAGYLFDSESVWLGSNSQGYKFYMYSYYDGSSLDLQVQNVPGYDGGSAEAILERPDIGGLTNLSNFGTLAFANSYANGTEMDHFSAYNPAQRHGIQMTRNGMSNGFPLADTNTIGPGGNFTVTQEHCQ